MKKGLYFSFATLIIIFSSCTTAYIPTELNVPAFTNENQFKGSITYGSSGANLKLAYSFPYHFALLTDVSYLSTHGSEPNWQRSWGAGIGYYTALHKMQTYGELIAGFNLASTRSRFEEGEFTVGTGFENGEYWSIYIQPDISFPFDYIDLIFGARLKYMQYTKYNYYLGNVSELPKAFSMEPAFTFRAGNYFLKFQLQVGAALPVMLNRQKFQYNTFFSHAGLQFSF